MRFNIFENGKLIGQDYKKDKDVWMHKWTDCHSKERTFEPFGWGGRAKGENMKNWNYEEVSD